MKKILSFLLPQLKYFIINPFWWSYKILIIIIPSIIMNGLIWYLYLSNYKNFVSNTSVIYSSAVLVLNIFLANTIFPKQNLATYILLGTGFLIQIFIIYYLKIAYLSGAF
jgi:hypothetical protein